MKKQWRTFILLSPFLFMCSLGFATDNAKDILSRIRKDFAETTRNINNYRVESVTITSKHITADTPYYTAGDVIYFYFENKELKKISAIIRQSDDSKWIKEYYVKNDNAYFILQTYVTKENKDVYRYYFSSEGDLIWINNNPVDENQDEFKAMAGEILGEFNVFRQLSGE